MSKLVRFGVSLEEDLLKKFDDLISVRNYTNRSEAIRDLIRQELISRQWKTRGCRSALDLLQEDPAPLR